MDTNSVSVTIHLNDFTMTNEERAEATRLLLQQLNAMDEVNAARLIDDSIPSANHKGASTLVGLLSADATVGNARKVLGFMGDRWGDKPIELEIEFKDRKLKITARSREEFAIALKAAQEFIAEQNTAPIAIQPTSQELSMQ